MNRFTQDVYNCRGFFKLIPFLFYIQLQVFDVCIELSPRLTDNIFMRFISVSIGWRQIFVKSFDESQFKRDYEIFISPRSCIFLREKRTTCFSGFGYPYIFEKIVSCNILHFILWFCSEDKKAHRENDARVGYS